MDEDQASESTTELLDGEAGLAKNRSQCAAGQLIVQRDDCRPSALASELHVTAALADVLEAQPL